jgi:dTDP-4-amino-4,6-dideoxygalactose transaminase
MKEIKFNTIGKTRNYLNHLEYLFSDYEHLRQKVFTSKCLEVLQPLFTEAHLFLTHSATGALEMIAQCIGIQPGDEVIMPSFTFVSTANAFVKFGAVPVFVDCDPEELTISIDQVEQMISSKTKAVIAMHYIGHPCDMLKLKDFCRKYNLVLIEDAATGFGNQFNGKSLGSIGDFGVISFDSTKHISAIQGGLLIVNSKALRERIEAIYHIGTNRSQFEKGEVSHYDWVDVGSKYQMNELNAAFLYGQLTEKDQIIAYRKRLTEEYDSLLRPLESNGRFKLMPISHVQTNIHGYYLLFETADKRRIVQSKLMEKGIESFSHYRALHLSPKGSTYATKEVLQNSSKVAETLLRLPFHNDLTFEDVGLVCKVIHQIVESND